MCKFLVDPLHNLASNCYTVLNSKDFVDSIKSLTHHNNRFMCSLDVTSLFTNVPVQQTIDIIVDYFYSMNKPGFLNFCRSDFRKFLELALYDSYFIFSGELYKQIDGCSMGNPISPILANIFLCDFEANFLDKCPIDFRPCFYKRYVDDTFILFETEEQADSFLTYFNSKHPNLKFTIEKEIDCTISFLDVLIHKMTHNFATSVYRKTTFTGLGTNFLSAISFRYKMNVIRTLVHRAYCLSSSFEFFHNEIEFLRNFIKTNCFPVHLFDNFVRKFLNNVYQPNEPIQTAHRRNIYLTFPYLDYKSLTVEKDIDVLLGKYFPQINCTVVFRNFRTIGSYFRIKELTSEGLRAGVVYLYKCDRCNSSYIGSTAVQLTMRLCQHAGLSHRTFQPLNSKSHSAIRDHCDHSHGQCVFKKSNFKIIDSQSGPASDLRILESLHILTNHPDLNDTASSAPLNVVH